MKCPFEIRNNPYSFHAVMRVLHREILFKFDKPHRRDNVYNVMRDTQTYKQTNDTKNIIQTVFYEEKYLAEQIR